MEAPGSSKGSGRGPQSTKQGLLCSQEETAVPQDKGNCQCRADVSLHASSVQCLLDRSAYELTAFVKVMRASHYDCSHLEAKVCLLLPASQQHLVHCRHMRRLACIFHTMCKQSTFSWHRHVCDVGCSKQPYPCFTGARTIFQA